MAIIDLPTAESETRSGPWQAAGFSATRLPVTWALSGALLIAWVLAWIAVAFVACIALISLIALTGAAPPALNILAITDPIQLSVWVVGGLGGIGLVIVICASLRGIFRSLTDGDPFVPENARRLRRIAATLAVLEVMRHLIAMGTLIAEADQSFRIEINFVVWIAVAILVVLAHIFAQGAALREDSKLTV